MRSHRPWPSRMAASASSTVAKVGELVDVRAGDEPAWLARAQDQALVVAHARWHPAASPSSRSTCAAQRIGRLVRHIERQHADAIDPVGSSRRKRSWLQLLAHVEIADQRPVVRQPDIRHAEIGHVDAARPPARNPAPRAAPWQGRWARCARLALRQTRGAHEQVQLVRTPEGVEVAGHDHRLGGFLHQLVQVAQLVLADAGT